MQRYLMSRPSMAFVLQRARETAMRFPLVLLSAVFVSVYAIWLIASNGDFDRDGHMRSCFILALGIPLFLATSLFRERCGWNYVRGLYTELIFGGAFLATYLWLAHLDKTDIFYVRYAQVSLILHLLVSFTAFLKRTGTGEFWEFNRRIFVRILLSTLYGAVFYVGLSIALITIKTLFKLNFDEKVFGQLFVFTVFIVQTWHFLAGVPQLDDLKEPTEFPSGLKFFVQFLLIPIVSLYMIILYSYMAKILISQDWPKGYIGWLVSAMAVLGVFNLLLIDPEKRLVTSRWIQTYSKFFYVLILPLLGMLFVAIGQRISAYGVTEMRYFLLLLGVWLVGIALYFLVSRQKNIKVIPVSLCLLGVITLAGPWSAYGWSLRSQTSRTEELMVRIGVLQDGKLKPATGQVTEEDEKRLSSSLDYLLRSHGSASLSQWFSADLLKLATRSEPFRSTNSANLMQELNLDYVSAWGSREQTHFVIGSDSSTKGIDISGYRSMMTVELSLYGKNSEPTRWLGSRNLRVLLKPNSSVLLLRFDGGNEKEVSLEELIQRLRKTRLENGQPALDVQGLSADELRFDTNLDGVSLRFYFSQLYGDVEGTEKNSKPVLRTASGWLLVK